MSWGELEELIVKANAAERQRLEDRIEQLETQRQEIVQEYEQVRDALLEELRPVRRRVDNRSRSARVDEVVERQQVLESELREVRRRFRQERQKVEREIAEVRDELARIEESETQVHELVEETLDR